MPPARRSPARSIGIPATGARSGSHLPHRGRKATLAPDAPALISFTSGSTGRPKGALISHRALTVAANAYAEVLETTAADSTLVLVPLFHNTGFCDQVAHMLLVGGSIDLLGEFGKATAREALLRRPASYLIAVPGILRLLALSPDADRMFRDCRIACYGGAPMPAAWIDELAARWPALALYNCYGLTEFTSVSHILEPSDLPEHHGSVGCPVPGVEQQIVDAGGRPLPAGTAGQLMLAGPSRMSRYWAAPDRTREVLRGRWLMTGDVGSLTDDGHLQLLGRASEVINRGGEKISPLQVEAAISLDPSVADVAVLGTPHPIFGERVVAFVTLRDAPSSTSRRYARRCTNRSPTTRSRSVSSCSTSSRATPPARSTATSCAAMPKPSWRRCRREHRAAWTAW